MYQFNVPHPFAVQQQPQAGSMFGQQPQFGMQPQYGMPQAMPQQMQQPMPMPQPHALTGSFQPQGQPQSVQQLTQTDGHQAQFNPALTNPTPYMGKTMQPQGVYAQSVPDYNAAPMPATGINALGFGTQPVPLPTVTR